MTVQELVENHAKEKGFDGLYNESYACACFNGDLFCCGFESCGECEFGFKKVCPHCQIEMILNSKDEKNFMCVECGELIKS